MPDDIGDFTYLGYDVNAYSPDFRRFGWDQDGTVVINEFAPGVKVFNSGENLIINSETDGQVHGASGQVISDGSAAHISYGLAYLTIIFPTTKDVSALYIVMAPADEFHVQIEVSYPNVDIGYLHNPLAPTTPSVQYSNDVVYDADTGLYAGTWSNVTSDFNSKVFRGERNARGRTTVYTALVEPEPSYLIDLQFANTPQTCLGLKVPYKIGYYSGYVLLDAIHVYGMYNDSDLRVVAFVDSSGDELTEDTSFGHQQRTVEKQWTPSSLLNQSSALYVKNINLYKKAYGVQVTTDDEVTAGMLQGLLLSLDGVVWRDTIELGDLDVGDSAGPIYVSHKPKANAPVGLQTSRLRLKVDHVI